MNIQEYEQRKTELADHSRMQKLRQVIIPDSYRVYMASQGVERLHKFRAYLSHVNEYCELSNRFERKSFIEALEEGGFPL